MQLNFDNRFVSELPGDATGLLQSRQTQGVCWAAAHPTGVANPRLLAYSSEVSQMLDLSDQDIHSQAFLDAFSGNRLLPGMTPYAACYGGHQFGSWAGQLGDGRAIALGETTNRRGQRWELQLKGAGMTPYSRRADGRAVLRSSLREFLCSEAMHHLGIPTTRALSLIATGEPVMRDMFYDGNPAMEPGAIVCRVSRSFIRFGNFEILASRGERELLNRLIAFTMDRDFPEIDPQSKDRFAIWFRTICERTAKLVVEWLRVGFVHGVMNTDNMSIIGVTIDYGPYGWVDNFDPGWTPNTTDFDWRRYTLAKQPSIARWNLERLADALETAAPSRAILDEGLAHFDERLQEYLSGMLTAKFGLKRADDEAASLVEDAFELMHQTNVDMREFFRSLAKIRQQAPELSLLRKAFYRDHLYREHEAQFSAWLLRYAKRLSEEQDTDEARRLRMNAVNPRFVLRNYLAQQAIDSAMRNDMTVLERLMEAARHPYDENIPEALTAKRPDWALDKPGCSMLSCSS